MSKSNAFETALLGLVFENTAITNVGDAGGLHCWDRGDCVGATVDGIYQYRPIE